MEAGHYYLSLTWIVFSQTFTNTFVRSPQHAPECASQLQHLPLLYVLFLDHQTLLLRLRIVVPYTSLR